MCSCSIGHSALPWWLVTFLICDEKKRLGKTKYDWFWFFRENQRSSSLKNGHLSNFYQYLFNGIRPSKMENSLWRHNEIDSLWHHNDEFPILDTKNFQEPPSVPP
jgi:hypothetical protein